MPSPTSQQDLAAWRDVREIELKRIDRETVLVRTVVGLAAEAGWIGLPTPMREVEVHGVDGRVAEPSALLEAVAGFSAEGVPQRAGRDVCFPFPAEGPDRGWILLRGKAPLPPDVDGIVSSVGTLVGLALARIRALDSLRRLNRQLKLKYVRRSQEVRTTLRTERRILDLERREGVHQLAAGVAHELNNPLGTLKASLEYLREEIEDPKLAEAVEDALADADRMAETVAGLFGEASAARRAAVRTSLEAAVATALEHFREVAPAGLSVESVLKTCARVGVPRAELTRWVFRLLQASASAHATSLRVTSAGRGVQLLVGGLSTGEARREIGVLLPEIVDAGGGVLVMGVEGGASIRVEFPPAVGDGA